MESVPQTALKLYWESGKIFVGPLPVMATAQVFSMEHFSSLFEQELFVLRIDS